VAEWEAAVLNIFDPDNPGPAVERLLPTRGAKLFFREMRTAWSKIGSVIATQHRLGA
jgi:hypothetical protein